jgi:hypothetical protein
MSSPRTLAIAAATLLVVVLMLVGSPLAAQAGAAEWRLEQPEPPEPPAGVHATETCVPGEPSNCHRTPVGLGRIGDIQFSTPNRGLLITDGNGSTVPPGIWDYNGAGWHELASVCGATDGRIAWAAPDEFWTISDGRPGQAANGLGQLPPLEDDTLCRFAFNAASERLEVAGSYAAPAFAASSYQPMSAAACLNATDCWFGGAPLPEPLPGAFQLHWNGSSLDAEPNTRAYSIEDMRAFEGHLYESLDLPAELEPEEIDHPYLLNEISTEGEASSFQALRPRSSATDEPLPEYASDSFPQALRGLRFSADEDSLWAAAGGVATPPEGSEPGELSVLRYSGGEWSQVLGAEANETVEGADPEDLANDVVSAIAAEPGTSSAWLATESQEQVIRPSATELATVAQVSTGGTPVSEVQLPSEAERAEGVGPKGAATDISCPARNDCWLATSQGWLFHLSDAQTRTLALDTDPAFNGPLVTFRPPDKGLPQQVSDALPINDSGEEESQPVSTTKPLEHAKAETFARVSVPLLSDERTRLIHGSTLELSFKLAVKARVRLLAKRHKSVVASTSTQTLRAGRRSLQLRLNAHRWPTKLELKTHALAVLPTESTLTSNVETVGTSLAFPRESGLSSELGALWSGRTL